MTEWKRLKGAGRGISSSNLLISIGFSLVIILMVTIAVIGLSSMGEMRDRLDEIVSVHSEKLKQISIMRRTNRHRVITLQRMLYLDDPFDIDEEAMSNRGMANDFIKARQRLDELTTTPAERAVLDQLREATMVGAPLNDQVRELVIEDELEQARVLMIEQMRPAQDNIYSLFTTLVAIYDVAVDKAVIRAELEYTQAYDRMLSMLAGVVLLSLLISWHVIRQTRKAEQALRSHRDELEHQVEARTLELSKEVNIRKNAEQVLQHEKARLDVTLASIGDGVLTTDDRHRVQYLNAVAEQITGWSREEAVNRQLDEVLPIEDGETLLVDQDVPDGEGVLVRRDNTTLDVQQSVARIKGQDGTGSGMVIVIRDVTENRLLARRLAYQATHDPLTGLINRLEFENRVAHQIRKLETESAEHGFFYLDLDQFKVVNDTCGHAAGDKLLRELCGLIARCLRKEDLFARLGGDEFGILIRNCPIEGCRQRAETIRKQVQEYRFSFNDQVFHVGVSVGLVSLNDHRTRVQDLFSAADSACYIAKERGRNQVHIYRACDEDTQQREGEMRWVARLQQALDENRFELQFQPIVPLGGCSEPSHYEALLRMHDHDGSLVYPEAFLPAAERYGLMPDIDRWVFHHALHWLGRHRAQFCGQRISINLSGVSISDAAFLEYVKYQFEASGASPDAVIIELTESSALNNFAAAMDFITTLKALGCQFALDDFGKGFSSLSNLKQLPVDYLKIDGGFILDILNDPVDDHFVRAICEIGHSIDKLIVAEYVESDEIRSRLTELGVDMAQGFGIARPAAIETFDSRFAEQTPRETAEDELKPAVQA